MHLRVQNEGIILGAPTYDNSCKGLTAVITGANGISGSGLVEWLGEHGERWSKVYAISRQPPPGQLAANIEAHSIDLLGQSSDDLAVALKTKGIQADYLFHFAYSQSSDTPSTTSTVWNDRVVQDNCRMLENIVLALHANSNNGSKKIKRVLLQTGTKHYGFQDGPMLCPGTEGDPPVETPNHVYYHQERKLKELAKNCHFEWNVVRPGLILGSPKTVKLLNGPIATALYLAINKEMGVQQVEYPGTFVNWVSYFDHSYSPLIACLEEWAVLTPACANEEFNVSNGDFFTYSRAWPILAAYFGLDVKKPHAGDPNEREVEAPYPSPRDGYKATKKNRIVLANWAKRDDVKEAWHRLQKKHNLQPTLFDSMGWHLPDFIFGTCWDMVQSMSKARKFGFFGYCDTIAAYEEMLNMASYRQSTPKYWANVWEAMCTQTAIRNRWYDV